MVKMSSSTNITELIQKAEKARSASRELRTLSGEMKNAALTAIAEAIENNHQAIIEANNLDMESGREEGLDESVLGRLLLNESRLSGMSNDLRSVADLPDPVGEQFDLRTLSNGIQIEKRRVPLGVIGCVYESRPNVTSDIVALCLKSGNTVVLRGGKEAKNSNLALILLIREAIEKVGISPDVVQFIDDPDRSIVDQMIKANDYIDLFIPRGGASLIQHVRDHATVPAITGGIGVVHIYVDASADAKMALGIVHNAKTQRPDVCNALDTLLVHSEAAQELLPSLMSTMKNSGVEVRCDHRSLSLLRSIGDFEFLNAASNDDFGQEFLSLIMSIKIVDNIEDAISHIHEFGSGHTEAIITEDPQSASQFLDEVEASVVLVNASTRFNDGGQLGLGAEVAISTNKLHARGPMGLRELTSYKWIAVGQGQIR
tara:strand:- start:688 stop:1977 length:1290 start_codon:yes stop_codon:yes gene_type:complete